LRALSWTLQAIADELGVAKGTVSVWVRDVDHVPNPRNRGHPAGPKHPMRLKKEAEIAASAVEAQEWVGDLRDRDLAMFALALYAGEGSKRDGKVVFANSDSQLVGVFLRWFRSQFDIDERRLRMRLYLHADLDHEAALDHWSDVTGIPISQFQRSYRADADPTMRLNRHQFGCASVIYSDSLVHRRVMALVRAVTSSLAIPR
jgi:hypothetical protein